MLPLMTHQVPIVAQFYTIRIIIDHINETSDTDNFAAVAKCTVATTAILINRGALEGKS